VASIVRAHGATVRQQQALSREQRQALRAIAVCRTPALGGQVDVCARCGFERVAYHSCRNRHCPKCQSLAQARWIAQRMARVLDVDYFHVVFTLPAALRSLALTHRRLVFALLLRASAETLLTLGRDPKRLGAELGITTVLHTWTRELAFHPHVHCIVTAGGLTADRRWRPARQRHLFPVRVLGALFRGKVLAALQRRLAGGELASADPVATRRTLGALHHTPWLVYVKRPFGGAKRLFQYLGRYTHRVGISNQRLVAVTPDAVTFRTKDGRTVTVPPAEFVRRLLLHVLPHGFVKIRHAGLFAPRQVATTLPVARNLLGDRSPVAPTPASPAPWATVLLRLTGVDVTQCPRCAMSPLERRVFAPQRERPPP
jgi:hypothetical protein